MACPYHKVGEGGLSIPQSKPDRQFAEFVEEWFVYKDNAGRFDQFAAKAHLKVADAIGLA